MITVASMKASKPLAPRAHSTIQTTRPAVTVRTNPIRGGILAGPGEARGEFADERSRPPRPDPRTRRRRAPAGCRRSRRRRPRRRPGAPARAWTDPEAERHRHLGARLRPRHDLREALLQRASRSPVVPTTETVYRKPRAARSDRRQTLGRRRGCDERHQRQARARRRRARSSVASSSGRSGTISPHAPVLRESFDERLDAGREDHVRVAHQHDRDARRQGPCHLEHAGDVRAGGQRARARLVDHGPVGERIASRAPRARADRRRPRRTLRRSRASSQASGIPPSGRASGRHARWRPRTRRRCARPRSSPRRSPLPVPQHLREVLVAATGQAHEIQLSVRAARAPTPARAPSRAPG